MSAIAPVKSLVFIDAAVDDYQSLIDGLVPGAEAIVLDSAQDGIEQITATLANRSDIQSVHIVSHGSPGSLQLGATTLNGESIDRYQAQLQGWRSALTEDADILIYGCDVAADPQGQSFVQALSQLTGADVAASDNLTGSTSKGGDWILEVDTGEIESSLAFLPSTTQVYDHTLATINVAVVGDISGGDQAGFNAIVNQLNDDTYFDFTATLVSSAQVDTAVELNAYNAVVIGNNGAAPVMNATFAAALRNWVEGGGGLVSTGWIVYGDTNNLDIDAVVPVNTVASYGFLMNQSVIPNGTIHPITTGVSPFLVSSFNEYATGGIDSGATTLATASGQSVVVVANKVSGKSVYLGPIYSGKSSYSTTDLRTGNADRLLEQAVAWAAFPIVSFTASTQPGLEGDVLTITVQLSAASNQIVTVPFALSGTANGADYSITPSPITIPAGSTSATITVNLIDDGVTEPSETVVVTIGSPTNAIVGSTKVHTITINVAPTLSDTTVTLAAVNEDAGLPVGAVGTLVSAIVSLGGNVSDSNASATTGIALTAVDKTNGTWSYTTNNGGAWTALGTVSNTSARLLVADASTRLYFQPNANYNGAIANAITFRAWDTTMGTNGGTADTSISGGGTAFSTATDTASIAINPINDAPALTVNATLTAVNEDTTTPAGATIATLFNTQFSDPDMGSSLGGVAVVGNTAPPTQGIWQYSTDTGTSWNAIATVTDGATALALSAATLVRFLPAANYNGTPTSLIIRALDDTYVGGFTNGTTRVAVNTTTNGGTTAIAAAVNTLGTSITSVNDAPVLTGSATLIAIDEDVLDAANTGTKVSALISGLTTDVDGDPKAIAITGVDNTKGAWQYSTNGGTTWVPITTTSDSNATLLGATSFYSANLGTAPSSQTWLGYTAVTIPPAGAPTPAIGTEATSANGALVTTTANQKIYAGYSNYNTSGTLINAASPTFNATTGYSVSFDLQVLADSNTNVNRAGFSILLVSQDTKAIELAFQRLSPTTGNIFAQNSSFVASESIAFNTNQKIDYRVEVLSTTYKLFANDTQILTGSLRDYTAFTPPANFPFNPYNKPNLIFLGDDTTSAQGTFNLSQVVVQTDNRVRFVPNANANGNSTINFRAWDTTDGKSAGAIVNASMNGGITSYSNASTTAAIAINPINDAPTISGTPAVTIAEDSPYSFTPTAVDVDASSTLTFSIANKPTWATFSTTTGQLSGTPVNADVGTTTGIVISVSDGIASPIDLPAFDLTVTNTNDAPTISGTPGTAIDEDSPYSFTPTAVDVDASSTLTFSIANKPTWATFDTTTGGLSGTPVNADVGTTTGVVISVNDGIASSVDLPAFDLTVTNTNDAPTISGTPGTTIAEDSPYSFTPSAIDVDLSDTLTFSIVNKPAWATFDPATGQLSGTPVNGDVGITTGIIISVSDGIAPAVALPTFDLAVTNTNDSPTISGTPGVTIAEDSPYTFAPTAIDVDLGATLTFSITNQPTWATFDPATGQLSGTPVNGDVGITTGIVISVSDGVAPAVALPTFDLAVTNTNDAPTISGTPGVTIAEDSPYTFTPTATDVDLGATLTFSIANKPTWATFDTTNGGLSGTPVNGDVGITTGIVISVSDGIAPAVALPTFDLAVTNTNDAPTISGTPAVTIAEDSPYSFTPTAVDVDASSTLTFTIANKPTWATFDTTTGKLSGTPANGNVGTTTGIIISVNDGIASPVALPMFDLVVTNINDVPTVTNAIADQSATENSLFTFAVPANTFTDDDAGDTLTYTVTQSGNNTSLPSWLTFNATNQTFSGTPTNTDIGSLDIKVTAKDTANATAEDIFRLTVANFNDAPTVANAIADQSATEDTLFTFAVPTNTFTDVDAGDVLTYTATQADNTPLPSWLTFNTTNKTFSGTPLNAQVGSLSVKVKATDTGLLTAEDIFKIDVANTNDAPTVTNAIADQTLTQDAPFTFTLPANTFTDVDAGDTLTYTATLANRSPLPTWLTFNSTTRTFSGTPRSANVGSLDLKVKATDKAGITAEDGFIVKVANINRSPVIGTPITPVPQQVTATQPFTLKIPVGAFTDPDAGDTLTFSASLESGAPLPPWLIFDAKTGLFSGIPDIFSVGNLSLKVNATDAQGSKTSQLVKLAIANPTGITGTPTPLIDFSKSKKGITLKAKKGQLLRGTSRSDILKGTKGSDRINSGGHRDSRSKDKLYGFNGNDRLKAGGGNDHADGGRGNDFLQGGKGRDLLRGSDGIDRLLGGKGDDLLIGGNGGDTLIGGKGRDMFVFGNVNEGQDAIADFNPSEDVIDLRSLFSQPQFAGATSYVRYLKYVQLTQVGASTEIKVDADGSRVGSTFTTLATLNNIGIGAVSSRNFVIS